VASFDPIGLVVLFSCLPVAAIQEVFQAFSIAKKVLHRFPKRCTANLVDAVTNRTHNTLTNSVQGPTRRKEITERTEKILLLPSGGES
jgi:hypothetical protein